jgi:hypothetical protein
LPRVFHYPVGCRWLDLITGWSVDRVGRSLQHLLNLKSATALGVTIPPSLLLRADQVIE